MKVTRQTAITWYVEASDEAEARLLQGLLETIKLGIDRPGPRVGPAGGYLPEAEVSLAVSLQIKPHN